MQKGHKTMGKVTKSKKYVSGYSKTFVTKEVREIKSTEPVEDEPLVKKDIGNNELLIAVISIVLYFIIRHYA